MHERFSRIKYLKNKIQWEKSYLIHIFSKKKRQLCFIITLLLMSKCKLCFTKPFIMQARKATNTKLEKKLTSVLLRFHKIFNNIYNIQQYI